MQSGGSFDDRKIIELNDRVLRKTLVQICAQSFGLGGIPGKRESNGGHGFNLAAIRPRNCRLGLLFRRTENTHESVAQSGFGDIAGGNLFFFGVLSGIGGPFGKLTRFYQVPLIGGSVRFEVQYLVFVSRLSHQA